MLIMVQTFNPSTGEAQAGLLSEILTQSNKQTKSHPNKQNPNKQTEQWWGVSKG